MIKHIKEYLSFYVYGFGFTTLIGFFAVSSWLERYEPPVGIVVNMKGEIIGKNNTEKESAQGAEFWQHQLVAVREAINSPERISSQYQAIEELHNKSKLISDKSQKITDDAVEKLWEERGMNTPDRQRVRVAEKELRLKQDEVEYMKRRSEMLAQYDKALERRPALIELEKIITSKLLKQPNE
jgi:hypothetical protein